MDKQVVSSFQFETYVVNEIRFIHNPEFVFDRSIDVDFKTNLEIKVNEEHQRGIVVLNATVFDDAKENNFPFSLFVSMTGYFRSESENPVSGEQLASFCEINGTAALFPFLRSVVADITKVSNEQPLILPLFNIHSLIELQKGKSNQQKPLPE